VVLGEFELLILLSEQVCARPASTTFGYVTNAVPPQPKRKRRPPLPLLRVGAKLTPKVLPRIPAPLQRTLAGGGPVVIDGNTLDPTLQLLVAALRLNGVTALMLDEDDVAASRQAFNDLCVSLGGPPVDVEMEQISIDGIGVRHYRPHYRPVDGAPPLLVFFHGGGYVLGELDSYDALCRLICRDAQVQVLSVDYRLAPEHPAPAAVDDCYAAYLWAVEHAERLGADPARIAVGGDSAGGALAAVVAQLARDAGPAVPPPVLQLLIYPWTDLTAPSRSRALFAEGFVLTQRDLDWCGAAYLAGSGLAATDPRVSPARAAELSGLPPALVLTAGFDPLRDEGDRYAEALAAAGVPVDLRRMDSLLHGFVNFHELGGAVRHAITEMISALAAHLRRS